MLYTVIFNKHLRINTLSVCVFGLFHASCLTPYKQTKDGILHFSRQTFSLFSHGRFSFPWYLGYEFCCQRQQWQGRIRQIFILCVCGCVFEEKKRWEKEKREERLCMRRCVFICFPSIYICECLRTRVCVCVLGEQCSQAADIIHLPVTGPGAAGKAADSSPAPTTKAAS